MCCGSKKEVQLADHKITAEELKHAQAMVKQARPLAKKSIYVKLPFLKYILCCSKSSQDQKKKKDVKNIINPLQTTLIQAVADHSKTQSLQSLQANQASNLVQRLNAKNQEIISKYQLRENPYMKFGMGIYGFLQLMRVLIVAFFVMSLIAVVQMYKFRKVTGYNVHTTTML